MEDSVVLMNYREVILITNKYTEKHDIIRMSNGAKSIRRNVSAVEAGNFTAYALGNGYNQLNNMQIEALQLFSKVYSEG